LSALLLNSLIASSVATALAVVFGLATALFVTALPTRAQRILLFAAVIALALPPFVVVNCWLHYLGGTGVWRRWLNVDIFNVWGVAWLLALMLWPLPFGAIWSAWRALDSAHLEAEPSLSGFALVRRLLLPATRNSLAAAALFTFALALNQFSIPAILQVKVLPVEFWIRFNTNLRAGDALAACWPIIIIPFAALFLLRQTIVRWSAETVPANAHAFRRQLGPAVFVFTGVVTVLVVGFSIVLPLFQLSGAARTWTELPQVFNATIPIIMNTFLFAACAALLAVLISWLVWRFQVGSLLWLLFLMPGMILSLAIIWLFNRPLLELIYRSAAVVIIALCLRFVGPVWALIRQAFKSTDTALVEAARLEGLRGWAFFRHAYLPRVGPAALAAWYMAYLLSLWDVETITLLYPPGSETLALRAFNLLHYGHTAQVNGICLLLIGLAMAPAVIYSVTRALLSARPLAVGHSPTNATLRR
jgi:iron(III) transport system permease protein